MVKELDYLNKYDVFERRIMYWRMKHHDVTTGRHLKTLQMAYVGDETRKETLQRFFNYFDLGTKYHKRDINSLKLQTEHMRYVVLHNKVPLAEGEEGILHVAEYDRWMRIGRRVEPDYTENFTYDSIKTHDYEFVGKVTEKMKKKVWSGRTVKTNEWTFEPYY